MVSAKVKKTDTALSEEGSLAAFYSAYLGFAFCLFQGRFAR